MKLDRASFQRGPSACPRRRDRGHPSTGGAGERSLWRVIRYRPWGPCPMPRMTRCRAFPNARITANQPSPVLGLVEWRATLFEFERRKMVRTALRPSPSTAGTASRRRPGRLRRARPRPVFWLRPPSSRRGPTARARLRSREPLRWQMLLDAGGQRGLMTSTAREALAESESVSLDWAAASVARMKNAGRAHHMRLTLDFYSVRRATSGLCALARLPGT